MTAISFYSHRIGKYRSFSNFSNNSVQWKGKTFPTSEHLYQWMKHIKTDPEFAEKIRIASSPMIAKKMGHSRQMSQEWDDIKIEKMFDIVIAKFQQNDDIRKILLETGDSILIEASPQDYFWGAGKDGTGRNELGNVLMRVRKKLTEN